MDDPVVGRLKLEGKQPGVTLTPIATLKPGESWIVSNNSDGVVTVHQCPTDKIPIPPVTKWETEQ
jgi:hypothetical protein